MATPHKPPQNEGKKMTTAEKKRLISQLRAIGLNEIEIGKIIQSIA